MIDDEVHERDPRHVDDEDGAHISRYSVSEHSTSLKAGCSHDPDFYIKAL